MQSKLLSVLVVFFGLAAASPVMWGRTVSSANPPPPPSVTVSLLPPPSLSPFPTFSPLPPPPPHSFAARQVPSSFPSPRPSFVGEALGVVSNGFGMGDGIDMTEFPTGACGTVVADFLTPWLRHEVADLWIR
ncbi:hypothetical protein RSAG8_08272, partial [Rhizoctonia solani AG-8 WAC10335]